jgi:hypothetical protein
MIGASFASSFRTVVRPTNAALDIYGFECLIDRQGISGGEDWKRSTHQRACGTPTTSFPCGPQGTGFGLWHGPRETGAALNTDFDWLREHTRYLQRATEWDVGGRPENRLLSGNDILEAKAWAARLPKGAPESTALHLDFIRASEEEAEARSSGPARAACGVVLLERHNGTCMSCRLTAV